VEAEIKIKVGLLKIFKVPAATSERKQILNIFFQCWDSKNINYIHLDTMNYSEWVWLWISILRFFFQQVYWLFYLHVYNLKEKFLAKGKMTLQHMAQFNENYHWMRTSVRCIIFNPVGPEKATILGDDTVTLFPDKNTKSIQLRFNKQINISCGAFRPWTRNELAVGGAGGVCLWQQHDRCLEPQPLWIGLKNEDFVLNLQWLQHGHNLACALLYACCIQLWQPDTRQVLHEIQMLHPESFRWSLSFKPDIEGLFIYLSNDDKDNSNYNNFYEWESKINGKETLQSACWTTEGNLLFVARQSCKVFCCIPYAENGIFLKPNDVWPIETPLDLSCVKLHKQEYDLGEPQAIAIDPCNIYVAIRFKRHPVVLLCLHLAAYGCKVKLKPFNLINCLPGVNPTFITFAFDDHRKKTKRSLFIGLSSGNVQQLPLRNITAEELRQMCRDDSTQFFKKSNNNC